MQREICWVYATQGVSLEEQEDIYGRTHHDREDSGCGEDKPLIYLMYIG